MYLVNIPENGWILISNEQQYKTILAINFSSHRRRFIRGGGIFYPCISHISASLLIRNFFNRYPHGFL